MLKTAEINELMQKYNGEVLQELIKEADFGAMARAEQGPALSSIGHAAGNAAPKVGRMGKLWAETLPRLTAGVAIAGSLFMIDRLFVDKILGWLERRNSQRESREYFEKMLVSHPQLKEYDPEVLAKYWESLYHFAPNMAQDPLAAGAYITQSLKRQYIEEFGGPTLDIFKTLSEVQKNSQNEKGKRGLSSLGEIANKTFSNALDFKIKGKDED